MKNLFALLLVLTPWCFVVQVAIAQVAIAQVAIAQAAIAEQIYVVDIQQVIGKSNAGSVLRKRVEKEAVKRKAKIERLRLDLQTYEEKLRKQKALLSEAALHEKKGLVFQKRKNLARVMQDEKEYLQRESGKAVGGLIEKIRALLPQAVKAVGGEKAENDTIVIERDPQIVVYVSDKYDLTDAVITLLNKQSVSF